MGVVATGFNLLMKRAYRDGEGTEERLRKQLLVPISLVGVLATLFILSSAERAPLRFGVLLTIPVAFTLILAYVYSTRSLPFVLCEAFVAVIGFRLSIVGDFETYGEGDMWPFFIVTTDLMVITGSRRSALAKIEALALTYFVVQMLLRLLDVRVYDHLPELSTTYTYTERSASSVVTICLLRITAVLSAFFMVNYFSRRTHEEQMRMLQSVHAAEKVASALVDFDLDLAEAVLEGSSIDPHLREALRGLLTNLRTYRPYLPDALFSSPASPSLFNMRQPPYGTEVAIVFTDIQASTAIWNTTQTGMKKAMVLHDRVLREAIAVHNGYEVKTIGDSFMVAFDTAVDAVLFALSVQEALVQTKWPDEILDHPLCQRCSLWGGLRVRIGIHVGDAYELETNPVTGRADYFGPVVNAASRIEGVAHGGVIAVSKEVLDQVWKHASLWTMHEVGPTLLNGIMNPVNITLLCPKSLAGRLHPTDSVSLIRTVSSESNSNSSGTPVFRCPTSRLTPSSGTTMKPLQCTMACLRVDYKFITVLDHIQYISHIINSAVDCTERTNGKVLSVCSSSIIAAWNIGQSCTMHHLHAARCVAFFLKTVPKEDDLQIDKHVSAGISSGVVLYGTAGTGSQRFITAIGQCVEISGALASSAATLPSRALVAAVPGSKCAADDPLLAMATRLVDEWELENGKMPVFEFDTSALLANREDRVHVWPDDQQHQTVPPYPDARTCGELPSSAANLLRPLPCNYSPLFNPALDTL